MSPKKKGRTRSLGKLSPSEFENLIYDLAIARRMVNVVWRTPGADGGRDIEAATVERDFSGHQYVAKWFVECKRYAKSVDWPTIYGKLAYADSHHADFLLLCTTGKFSPNAITQVESWNCARRWPRIRLWPSQEIENQLRSHPDIQVKYGLLSPKESPGGSVVALALAVSKAVGSLYSASVFGNKPSDPMLQAAGSMSELLLRRMEDMDEEGRIRPIFRPFDSDGLEQCGVVGTLDRIDEVGLRAFAAYLIALTRRPLVIVAIGKGRCQIDSGVEVPEILTRYRDSFSAIAFWSDFEFSFDNKSIFISQRL